MIVALAAVIMIMIMVMIMVVIMVVIVIAVAACRRDWLSAEVRTHRGQPKLVGCSAHGQEHNDQGHRDGWPPLLQSECHG
jgi:hypothetical protein